MRCYSEIDFKRKTISIEEKLFDIFIELKRKTFSVDRIFILYLLEQKRKQIAIDKMKYKVISIYIPYFTDWVILQNDYLPNSGEYYLN